MKNFRDFGYLNIKNKMLYRGEALTNTSKKDIALLKEKYNIKTIIDLRMEEEVNKEKDQEISDIKNIHIPLVTSNNMALAYQKAKSENREMNMSDIYEVFVSRNTKDSWTKIFDALITEDCGILLHCTQGKDRTGVVVAMILSLLGVDKDTIYDDYLLTNNNIKIPFNYRIKAMFVNKTKRDKMYSYFRLKKEYLDSTFSYINKEYGSIDVFFKECCSLDENKINSLKNKYINGENN